MDEIDFPPRAFNDGEVSVQKQRGVTQEAIETNYMVTPFLPPMSDGFLRSTRFVVMGSVDPEGRVWAHVAYGEPGFFHALSAERVRIAPQWSPDPLLAAHLIVGAPVATLVVDLETRRRFRVNGRVATSEAGAWSVDVGEAYPNCPKYIQKRARVTLTSAPPASAPAEVTVSAALSTEQRAQIAAADTFYIATHHPQSGLDVSHRGGRSGFVRILTDRELVWPDYKGNNLFMSLGNIAVNPHCGITFVNPETGSALQLIGRAELIWDSNLSLDLAQLSVRFRITSVRSTPHYSPLRYKLVQPSPFNPQLQDRQSPLSLLPSRGAAARCVGVHSVTPSSDVRTFRFRTDSDLAPQPVPGQYVTLRFLMNGVLTERTWTITSLSGSLPRNEFEVSVKRKPNGAASNWIHDHLNGQSEIRFEVCGVSGDFSPFREGENGALALRHPKHSSLLLLAGGIGLTPFIPVVRHLAAINFPIKTNLILSNKDIANAPFVEELRRIECAHPERLTLRLCVTQAASAPAPHYAGRLTAQAIRDLCPDLASSGLYVCGPEAYIRHTLSLLAGLGVPADSVALERFDF